VVTKEGPGFTKASVLIVAGRVDCEKSRKVIWQALSPKRYKHRRIAGWDCASTARASASGLFGASCEAEGERGREVIKSTTPHRCPDCDSVRNRQRPPAAPAAAARKIASSTDKGSLPLPSAFASIPSPSHRPRVMVKAEPREAVEVQVRISCFRGQHNRSRTYELKPQRTPIDRRFPLTIEHGAAFCTVSASASYDDIAGQSGRIAVSLYY
jgi:hypothetical protein